MTDLATLGAQCRRIASGDLTAADAIRGSFERARRLEPELQAFAVMPETTPVPGHGPLSGAALAVKDLFDTVDMPTAYGTGVLRHHRPIADAAVVAHLRACGATVLGKTVTTEFAYQQPGPTRNPWNRAHTPGGSSSGSAAAVAAGIAPLALGTQTMGSIIRPAAFCGVVGFKPTFGTLPRDGVHPLCDALDHVGLFARAVDDVAVALRCLGVLPEAGRPTPRSLRFGLLPLEDPTIGLAQHAAMRDVVTRLRSAGHTVDEAVAPDGFDEVGAIIETLMSGEADRHFGAIVAEYGDRISAPIRALVERGRMAGDADHRQALTKQATFRDAHARAAAPYDALLTVPASGEAPEGLGWTGDPRFCAPWSLAGVPAVAIPAGLGSAGLPLGVQLVGRWGEDAALLSVAAAVEALLPPIGAPTC